MCVFVVHTLDFRPHRWKVDRIRKVSAAIFAHKTLGNTVPGRSWPRGPVRVPTRRPGGTVPQRHTSKMSRVRLDGTRHAGARARRVAPVRRSRLCFCCCCCCCFCFCFCFCFCCRIAHEAPAVLSWPDVITRTHSTIVCVRAVVTSCCALPRVRFCVCVVGPANPGDGVV